MGERLRRGESSSGWQAVTPYQLRMDLCPPGDSVLKRTSRATAILEQRTIIFTLDAPLEAKEALHDACTALTDELLSARATKLKLQAAAAKDEEWDTHCLGKPDTQPDERPLPHEYIVNIQHDSAGRLSGKSDLLMR